MSENLKHYGQFYFSFIVNLTISRRLVENIYADDIKKIVESKDHKIEKSLNINTVKFDKETITK